MKRILVLSLILALLIPLYVVPASASELEISYVELLDIGYWYIDGEFSTSFELPAGKYGVISTLNRVGDVFIYYVSTSGASVVVNGVSLSPEPVSGNVYMVRYTGNTNALRISSGSEIQLVSVRAYLLGTGYKMIPFDFSGTVEGVTVTQTAVNSVYETFESLSHSYGTFKITIPGDIVRPLDFVSFDVLLESLQVTGISVVCGGVELPFSTGSFTYNGEQLNTPHFPAQVLIPFTIDTSSCRSSDVVITIRAGALSVLTEFVCTVTVSNSRGVSVVDGVDSTNSLLANIWNGIKTHTAAMMQGFDEVFTNIFAFKDSVVQWFGNIQNEIIDTRQSILNFLAELFSGEDGPQAGDFNGDLDQQATEFQEMEDVMASAPTVNIDNVEDLLEEGNLYVGNSSVVYTAAIANILNTDVLTPIFVFCGFMAMLGYLLYGKA